MAAINAHGGPHAIKTTLIGKLQAKVSLTPKPGVEALVSWEETFELPRRSRRLVKGQQAGKDFSLEYAVTQDSGWVRHDGGEALPYQARQIPVNRSWNSMLATLVIVLGKRLTLEPAGTEQDGGRTLVGVKVSGEDMDCVLFFDSQSKLLAKSRKVIQHPMSGEEVDAEVVFGDYKEVSGVWYPMRITSSSQGKKIIEMEIIRIEFFEELDDFLFEKPSESSGGRR
jgi:hypothetical protein